MVQEMGAVCVDKTINLYDKKCLAKKKAFIEFATGSE